MADFVAVIRRAVDGLADNSPEMRVKVYDKARGAVRRQLEAMNPRPSDDLVQRQLDKLEAAIAEVEGDHAEALPAEEFVEPFESAAPEPAPAPELPPAPEPPAPPPPAPSVPETSTNAAPAAPAIYPAEAEAVSDAGPAQEPHRPSEEAVETRPAFAPEEYPPAEPAEAAPQHWAPGTYPETYEETPAPAAHSDARYEAPMEPGPAEPAPVEPAPVEPALVEPVEPAPNEPVPVEFVPVEPRPAETAHAVDPGAEAFGPEEPHYIGMQPHEPRSDEHAAFDGQAAAAADVYAAVAEQPPAPEHPYAPEHPATAQHLPAADAAPSPAAMPATAMPWAWSDERADTGSEEISSRDVFPREQRAEEIAPASAADADAPEWTWPEDARPAEPGSEQKRAAENAWGDLEDLIGYQPKSSELGTAKASGLSEAPAATAEAPARNGQRSFRAAPRSRRISIARIGVAAAVLALVGGAGAAYWLNRDSIDRTLADLTAPVADPSGNAGATGEAGSGSTDAAGAQEVASAGTGINKFTQRLLPDGTETDEGPAAVAGEPTSEEGKSVTEQTTEVAAAGIDPATTASDTAAAPATPAGAAPATPATQPTGAQTAAAGAAAEQAPVGVSQKMFLYEERLGQSAPTAIDGTVIWSKAEESPGGDARPEPVIRAQITVPSNGLSAQLLIRRNADKSLPASHLVEIVFVLPPNFEGGSIDSVQRVAMKRTEQDRGDPLIAVPAKITEDFHMIALNDFPDAITRNADLLKNRDWIDIPITYRNGRRALLTLEKGTTGAEVFNSVLNAWAALAPPADSQ